MLCNPDQPLPIPAVARAEIDELLSVAGTAPFHYPSGEQHREGLRSLAPWRFYKLDAAACRTLLERLRDTPEAGKIRDMLAAADALVMVTWTPDANNPVVAAEEEPRAFDGTLRNMEHIAAASAAIQNFLLLATGAGWRSYWSSGGFLRSRDCFSLCNIPQDEILLGAIFLFPEDVGLSEVRPGKLRGKQGALKDWSVWIDL